jgi:hypothetical protein
LVRQSWIRQTGRRRLFAGSGGSCHIRSAHVLAVHITRRRGDSLTREARGTSSQSRPTTKQTRFSSQPASQPASQSGSCVSATANRRWSRSIWGAPNRPVAPRGALVIRSVYSQLCHSLACQCFRASSPLLHAASCARSVDHDRPRQGRTGQDTWRNRTKDSAVTHVRRASRLGKRGRQQLRAERLSSAVTVNGVPSVARRRPPGTTTLPVHVQWLLSSRSTRASAVERSGQVVLLT